MLETFTSQTFHGLIGQRFEVVPTHGHPFILTLSDCQEASHPVPEEDAAAGLRQPFSLLFHARPEVLVAQQICRLLHSQLGEFPLFLVPLGPDERGMRYEAVFS